MRQPMRIAILGLAVCLFLPATAAAQESDYSYVRIVRLSLVEGDVQVQRPESTEWEVAQVNLPLKHGYRVATGNGRAEIEFESGATARLASNTLLHFSELALENGGRVTRLTLRYGTATFYANLERRDLFRVSTSHLEAEVSDNSRFRLDATDDGSWVTVLKGDVAVDARGGGYYRLTKGRSAYVNAIGQVALERASSPDAWDRWVSGRDEVVLSASNYSRRYTNAPFNYGMADLYHYGSWYNVPGYGYCWQPYALGVGWSPFLYGKWVFLRHVGWTWVSFEPWGWVPYHYGRWTFVQARGWLWVPGHFNRFHGGAVHWVRHSGRIGWIPRSPRDRAGQPPANLPGGTVVNTGGGGAIGGAPNVRAEFRPGDAPPVFINGEPELNGFSGRGTPAGERNRERVGRRPDGTPFVPGDNPRPASGAVGERPVTGTPPNVELPGRPMPQDPDSGVVYDPKERRWVNNPRAPVRPPVVNDGATDANGRMGLPSRPTRDATGDVARPNPRDVDRGTLNPGNPGTGAIGGDRRSDDRPGPIPRNDMDSRDQRPGQGQVGGPPRPTPRTEVNRPSPAPPSRPTEVYRPSEVSRPSQVSRPSTPPPAPPMRPSSPPPSSGSVGSRPSTPPPVRPSSPPPSAQPRPSPTPPPRPVTRPSNIRPSNIRPSSVRPSSVRPSSNVRPASRPSSSMGSRPAPASRPSATPSNSRPPSRPASRPSRPANRPSRPGND